MSAVTAWPDRSRPTRRTLASQLFARATARRSCASCQAAARRSEACGLESRSITPGRARPHFAAPGAIRVAAPCPFAAECPIAAECRHPSAEAESILFPPQARHTAGPLLALLLLVPLVGGPRPAVADIAEVFSGVETVLSLDMTAGGSNGPLGLRVGRLRTAPHLSALEYLIAVRPAASTPGQLEWVAKRLITGSNPVAGGGLPVTSVRAFVVGDFDGDGLDDLAVLPAGSPSVAIGLHRQTGSGLGFEWTLEPLPLPFTPASLTVADLDDDGRDDLVVSFESFALLALLHGLPRGGEQVFAASTATISFVPDSLDVGRWNDDAHLDLLLFSASRGEMSVLAGDGARGWTADDLLELPVPHSGRAADLDGDGRADLVLLSGGSEPSLRTYLRQADDSLVLDRAHPLPDAMGPLFVGQVSLGAAPDAAVLIPSTGEVRVFLNSGRGSLVAAGSVLGGSPATHLIVHDLVTAAAIEMPDLGVASASSSDVRVVEGLHQPYRFYTTSIPGSGVALREGIPAFADVNGDGLIDMVFRSEVDRTPPQGAQCLLQGPGREFIRRDNLVPSHEFVSSVLLANVRGSALPDLIGVSYEVGANAGASLIVVAENVDGEFHLRETIQTGTQASPRFLYFLVAGDWNGDGRVDFAVADDAQGDVLIFLADVDGTFSSFTTAAVGATASIDLVAGDLDLDGRPDLVWCDYETTEVIVLMNDGSGGFTRTFAWADPAARPNNIVNVAIRDVTHDGVPDLVVFNRGVDRVVGVLPGRGDGTFDDVVTSGTTTSTVARTLADLDGDGLPEVVIFATAHVADRAVNMTAFRLTEPGRFGERVAFRTTPQNFPILPLTGILMPVDFDGDGLMDLAAFVGSIEPADPGFLWNLGAAWGGGVVPSSAAWVE